MHKCDILGIVKTQMCITKEVYVYKYPNLAAELARNGMNADSVANAIGKGRRATYQRLSGSVPFAVDECVAIKDKLFPSCTLKYLFKEND